MDSDLNGLSIGAIDEIEIEGEKLFKPVRRKAFRKIDKDGNENKNFFNEIDEWTGEKDFVKNKVNF